MYIVLGGVGIIACCLYLWSAFTKSGRKWVENLQFFDSQDSLLRRSFFRKPTRPSLPLRKAFSTPLFPSCEEGILNPLPSPLPLQKGEGCNRSFQQSLRPLRFPLQGTETSLLTASLYGWWTIRGLRQGCFSGDEPAGRRLAKMVVRDGTAGGDLLKPMVIRDGTAGTR